MLKEDKLKEKALSDCQQHVSTLLSGDMLVEPNEESQLSWNEVELRHYFSQHMVIWRRCAGFTVVLNAGDEPVGYIDDDKWAECEWAPMSHESIVELAAETGFVPAESSVLSDELGDKDCIKARLSTNPEEPDAPRYIVQVNPVRRRIISILPEEAAE